MFRGTSKDEHRMFRGTSKEVGFSSHQHFSCPGIFAKVETDRFLTSWILIVFECEFFVLWAISTNSKRKCLEYYETV